MSYIMSLNIWENYTFISKHFILQCFFYLVMSSPNNYWK